MKGAKKINAKWKLTMEKYPSTEPPVLHIWNEANQSFQVKGNVRSCSVPKGQPIDPYTRFVHIETTTGKYQCVLSQVSSTSAFKSVNFVPTDFRANLTKVLQQLKERKENQKTKQRTLSQMASNEAASESEGGLSAPSETEADRTVRRSPRPTKKVRYSTSEPSTGHHNHQKEEMNEMEATEDVESESEESEEKLIVNRKSATSSDSEPEAKISLKKIPAPDTKKKHKLIKPVKRPESTTLDIDDMHEDDYQEAPGDSRDAPIELSDVETPRFTENRKPTLNSLLASCQELGFFDCNPELLQPLPPNLQVRAINGNHVTEIVNAILNNNNAAVAPLLAMTKAPFQQDKLTKEQFEAALKSKNILILGGNHTRQACMEVAKKTGTPLLRKVLVYNWMPVKQMRAIAIRHNKDNQNNLIMTFKEQMLFLRSELRLRNMQVWDKETREELSAILSVKPKTCDSWFQLSQLPIDAWNYIEVILQGAHPPSGVTHLKKLIGLPNVDKVRILRTTIEGNHNLHWMAQECESVRMILRIKSAMMLLMGTNNWIDLSQLFPQETNEANLSRWIPVFRRAKISRTGRLTKYLRPEEIPPSFTEMCQRLQRRRSAASHTSSTQNTTNNNPDPDENPDHLRCQGDIVRHESVEYAVVCGNVEEIGQKVFRDDYNVITAHLPKPWQTAIDFKDKLATLIDNVKTIIHFAKAPVWFWICELESIGIVQNAMEDSGFGRIWNGVVVTLNCPVSASQKVLQTASLGVVCGTYAPSAATEPFSFLPQQRVNVFSVPYCSPPTSTDTHEPVCKSAISKVLMERLLGMVVKPGTKILELFARCGPVMQYAIETQFCSCISVDSSAVVSRYLSQSVISTLEATTSKRAQEEDEELVNTCPSAAYDAPTAPQLNENNQTC